MTLFDSALVIASNAVDAAITHVQLHSAAPTNGVGSEVGARVAVNGTVDADGDITINASWTGLTANQPVWGISYWTALSGGTCHGQQARTAGDATANAAGAYNYTAVENLTAT